MSGIVGLMRWAERHLGDARDVPALELVHRSCGRPAEPYLACAACDEPLTARDVEVALRQSSGYSSSRAALAVSGLSEKTPSTPSSKNCWYSAIALP